MPRLSGKVQTFFYFSPAVEFVITQEVTGLSGWWSAPPQPSPSPLQERGVPGKTVAALT